MGDQKMSGAASPPFATKDGKPQGQGSGSSGAANFVTDANSKVGDKTGPGYLMKDRPQSEARPEVVPNPQSVVAGGKILKADPGPVSAKVAGTAASIPSVPRPFKGLK
jgi:hypothetical protein